MNPQPTNHNQRLMDVLVNNATFENLDSSRFSILSEGDASDTILLPKTISSSEHEFQEILGRFRMHPP